MNEYDLAQILYQHYASLNTEKQTNYPYLINNLNTLLSKVWIMFNKQSNNLPTALSELADYCLNIRNEFGYSSIPDDYTEGSPQQQWFELISIPAFILEKHKTTAILITALLENEPGDKESTENAAEILGDMYLSIKDFCFTHELAFTASSLI